MNHTIATRHPHNRHGAIMDDPTEAQRIASQVIEAWHHELTDTAQGALSGNDLAALENMVAQAIAGDLDFLGQSPPDPTATTT